MRDGDAVRLPAGSRLRPVNGVHAYLTVITTRLGEAVSALSREEQGGYSSRRD